MIKLTSLNKFLTIKKTESNQFIINKSKFIANIKRTDSVDQANAFIAEIQNKYSDASHNTFAYTIGDHNQYVKASDNGEPSGTAGAPELKTLQLMHLQDVTVVVTRYFGGIELGAGGLIRAYSNSVTQVVHKAGVVQVSYEQDLAFHIPYNKVDEVNHYLSENKIFIGNQDYGVDVIFHIFLPEDKIISTQNDLTNILAGKVEFIKGEFRSVERPIETKSYHEI